VLERIDPEALNKFSIQVIESVVKRLEFQLVNHHLVAAKLWLHIFTNFAIHSSRFTTIRNASKMLINMHPQIPQHNSAQSQRARLAGPASQRAPVPMGLVPHRGDAQLHAGAHWRDQCRFVVPYADPKSSID
jgi:hypothetical protein